MNRKIVITAAVILYALTGAAALFLFRQMEMEPIIAGEIREVSLSSPVSLLPEETVWEEESAVSETESAVPKTPPSETADAEQETLLSEDPPEYVYKAIHTEGRLFIRESADINSPILGFLSPGDWGDVLDLGDDWALIQNEEITGYVSKTFLELTVVKG